MTTIYLAYAAEDRSTPISAHLTEEAAKDTLRRRVRESGGKYGLGAVRAVECNPDDSCRAVGVWYPRHEENCRTGQCARCRAITDPSMVVRLRSAVDVARLLGVMSS